MSDIREAFEKWIESRTGGHFAIEDYNDYSLDFACEAWQAALQSQTAPAVPEGLIDKIKREIGFANAGAESHKGRAGEQLRAICIGKSQALQYVLSMLDAAPQPDHSPDGGKVLQPDPVPYEKHERECGKLIDERDHAQDWADKLAGAIGEHFGIDIGEHSNCNCPWETAFDNMPDAPAADGGEVEPADDSSTVYRIGDLGNQIRNLGCLQKHNEEMANSLAELAHQAWVLQRDVMRELTATHPTQPRNEEIAADFEAWLSQVRYMEGLSAHDIIESAEDYITLLRSNGGDV